LVFFAEFLATTGVFERWVSSCPLEYHSGNASDKRDVLGTLMLGLKLWGSGGFFFSRCRLALQCACREV
jgi:hypothetical protein